MTVTDAPPVCGSFRITPEMIGVLKVKVLTAVPTSTPIVVCTSLKAPNDRPDGTQDSDDAEDHDVVEHDPEAKADDEVKSTGPKLSP